MNAAIAAAPLTRQDLAALRSATSIVFHHVQVGEPSYGNPAQGKIVALKDVKRRDGFWDTLRQEIECASHASHLMGNDRYVAKACDSVTSAQYHEVWKSIARHVLKVGDVLSLRWWADNNSAIVEAGGLHEDSLFLEVLHGHDRLRFHLSSRISLDNSARMCQARRRLGVDVAS